MGELALKVLGGPAAAHRLGVPGEIDLEAWRDQAQEPAGLELAAGKVIDVPASVPPEAVAVAPRQLLPEGVRRIGRVSITDAQPKTGESGSQAAGHLGIDSAEHFAALGDDAVCLQPPEPKHHLQPASQSVEKPAETGAPAGLVVGYRAEVADALAADYCHGRLWRQELARRPSPDADVPHGGERRMRACRDLPNRRNSAHSTSIR